MSRANLSLSMPVITKRIIIKQILKSSILLLMFSIVYTSYAETYENNDTDIQTKSKRIEVYSLSQNYWDTQYGETLGDIVHHLLPNNPAKRKVLEQDILKLNPGVFINGNPDQLLAKKRLWLPGYMKQADTKINPDNTILERYSWGNIKRPR